VEDAKEKWQAFKMRDVKIKSYEPKKFSTTNPKDDRQYFNYKKAVEEYGRDAKLPVVKKEEKINMVDRILARIPEGVQLNDGSYLIEITDDDLPTEEEREKRWNVIQAHSEEEGEEADEDEEEDEDDDDEIPEEEEVIKKGWEDNAEYVKDYFENNYGLEFEEQWKMFEDTHVFKKEEEYDLVKDLEDAFDESLMSSASLNDKISELYDLYKDNAYVQEA